MGRWRVVAVAVAAALLTAACGLPTDESYAPIDSDDMPFALAEATTTSSSSTTTAPARSTTSAATTTTLARPTTTVATESITLWFVLGNRLKAVPRVLRQPVTPKQAIVELLAGPREADRPTGLRTTLDPGMVDAVTRAGGVATVNLTAAFVAIPGQDQPLAFGQVVSTLTRRPGIGQVRFTRAGKPQPAFAGDGSLTTGPLTDESYAGLRRG
jgi:spore germination protein GerM